MCSCREVLKSTTFFQIFSILFNSCPILSFNKLFCKRSPQILHSFAYHQLLKGLRCKITMPQEIGRCCSYLFWSFLCTMYSLMRSSIWASAAQVQMNDAAAVTCLLHSSAGDYSCTNLGSPRATHNAEQIFISHKNICPSVTDHSDNNSNSTILHLLQYHSSILKPEL